MIQRARARAVVCALLVSVASLRASACHQPIATAPHTQPSPATRAIAAAAPTLTDQQWIDSVAQSWAAQPSTAAVSNAVRPAAVPGARRSLNALAVASSAPITSATSYAEAASLGTGPRGAPTDDHAALMVLCAIGAAAFVVALATARIAIGR
jgi:hypothetical protein